MHPTQGERKQRELRAAAKRKAIEVFSEGAGFSDGLIDAYAPRADYGINWDVMKAKAARDVAHVQHGGSMHLSGGGMHPGRGADGSLQMVPDILISLQAY